MTTIRGVGGTGPVGRSGRSATAGRSGFSVPADATEGVARPAAASAVGLVGMLALQEGESDAVQDRAARRHGQDMLGELAALQRALLSADGDPTRLESLAALAQRVPQATDPRLRALVTAIVVRARVEMARYDRAAPLRAEP